MTRTKSIYLALLAVLLSPMAANADVIAISGKVTVATGGLSSLAPTGTLVSGPMDVDSTAVEAGLAGPGDINSIDINVGANCFSTGPDSTACPTIGPYVPITSIDATALTFSSGIVGGFINVTSFSLPFQLSIPIMFNFTAGTFFADGGALGTASGVIAGRYEFTSVPEPGTLALLGLGLVGMAARRRKTV